MKRNSKKFFLLAIALLSLTSCRILLVSPGPGHPGKPLSQNIVKIQRDNANPQDDNKPPEIQKDKDKKPGEPVPPPETP
jgi:hypothetical protein